MTLVCQIKSILVFLKIEFVIFKIIFTDKVL